MVAAYVRYVSAKHCKAGMHSEQDSTLRNPFKPPHAWCQAFSRNTSLELGVPLRLLDLEVAHSTSVTDTA